MAHAYQLVIEFEGDDPVNFDRVIALEESLTRMFHEADFAGSFLLRCLHFVDLARA